MTRQAVTCRNVFSITPSDDTDLTNNCLIRVGGNGGDIKVTTTGGDTETLKNVSTGDILPIWIKKVFSTGTTATDLEGLY